MTSLRQELEGTLPQDLSQRIGKNELMQLVFTAIDEAQWPQPRVAEEDATPEPVLRTVLAFCYASGVYASIELEAMAKHDPSVRYLCANDFPRFEEIRRFRRQNIGLLRETLARVLHAGWRLFNEDAAVSFLPFVAEADHRLSLAVAADSAAMDF